MASLTRWTWVWVNSGSWWWTGRPGALRFMGSQRVRHNWVTELNWTELKYKNINFIIFIISLIHVLTFFEFYFIIFFPYSTSGKRVRRTKQCLDFEVSVWNLPLRPQRFKPDHGGSVVKNAPANAGDAGSIPVLGRSPGEGNGNPSQYSCLGNPMDRGGWWAMVHGVAKELGTTQQLKTTIITLRLMQSYESRALPSLLLTMQKFIEGRQTK